jgi:hypothetical protein
VLREPEVKPPTGGAFVSLLAEILIISGVAMDLVGAGVLSHAHNAESIAEIRAEIGAEKSAVGENDAIATHAQLLAEKRIGFFILTFGLTIYLIGLVLQSPEGFALMGSLAVGVIVVGLVVTVLWTRIVGNRVRDQAARAERKSDGEKLPEQ